MLLMALALVFGGAVLALGTAWLTICAGKRLGLWRPGE